MHISKQKGFDEFICIAEHCPESCCKCWQIFPDDLSLKRYKDLSASDARIRAAIKTVDGSFAQNDRVCGFLDPDELCYLQKTYGEEMLCDTCRLFPRHMEEFENVREFTLSLSCPHVASRLVDQSLSVEFEETYDEEEEEYEDFDCFLYDKLLSARELLLEIAGNRGIPLFERLNILCALAMKLQEKVDDGNLFETDEWIDEQRTAVFSDRSAFHEERQLDAENEKRHFSILYELETLHKDWTQKLDRAWETFFRGEEDGSMEKFQPFVNTFEEAGEQILVLLLYTYFCGAAYDGWIFSKAALAVYSVKWIFYIAYSEGGTKEDLIRTAYQYAREIEHSDPNLDALEEWFMK